MAGLRSDLDEVLADYRADAGPTVTKDDAFYYVYGLLHSPDYRERYAGDLKAMPPRIPKVKDVEDFRTFVKAGRELAALHVGYESVEPYPLTETVTGSGVDWELYRIQKMRFKGAGTSKDRSTVLYNSHVTFAGIPEVAYPYTLGSRWRSSGSWSPTRSRRTRRRAS